MFRSFVALCCFFVCSIAQAQPYQVGHTTITFNDAARTGGFGSGGGAGRQIQVEIYYPATQAGTDVSVASDTFPVVVFGHGFVMAWDAYQNIWDELVPNGYILVFPRTEGGFSPDHNEFALDLALCERKMQTEHTNTNSLFLGHVRSSSAITGHSMGGGASILAAAGNQYIKTVIAFAPAETTPSAISAAAQVTAPSLIFSGSSDGVTPPADHHIPIYNGLTLPCKHFISILGGAHCYFANSNFNCDFGESASSTGISVTRAEQHQVMFDYLLDWLDYKLKGDCPAFATFSTSLPSDIRITYQESCNSAAPTISANGPTTFCDGDQVTLSAGQVVEWSNGSVASHLIVNQGGNYFALDLLSCSISNTINIVVNALPDSTVSVSGNVLTANQVGGQYQWVDCDQNNQAIVGETNASFTPTSVGNYAVLVEFNGCEVLSICTNIMTIGFQEIASAIDFQIYPNPTSESFTMDTHGLTNYTIEIYTVSGKLVMNRSNIAESVLRFSSDVLGKGVYFVKLIHPNKGQSTSKIVVL
jgi:dienelactone hydrolase